MLLALYSRQLTAATYLCRTYPSWFHFDPLVPRLFLLFMYPSHSDKEIILLTLMSESAKLFAYLDTQTGSSWIIIFTSSSFTSLIFSFKTNLIVIESITHLSNQFLGPIILPFESLRRIFCFNLCSQVNFFSFFCSDSFSSSWSNPKSWSSRLGAVTVSWFI